MDTSIEKEIIYIESRRRELRKSSLNLSGTLASHNSMLRLLSTGVAVALLSILPQNLASSDPECGINRFNNESPLTERIVGGNNSLQ